MKVVTTEEGSKRRPAKRKKVAKASGEGRRSKARMAGTHVTCLRAPKRRVRSKKKANRQIVVSESSEGSVAMTEGAASTTKKDTRKEVNLRITEARPSRVQNEDPLEKNVEPLRTRTATSSQGLHSLERKQPSLEKNETSEKADVPEPKTSEEHAKELTMSEEILEQVVEQIGGMVVESRVISLPQVSLEVVRPKT